MDYKFLLESTDLSCPVYMQFDMCRDQEVLGYDDRTLIPEAYDARLLGGELQNSSWISVRVTAEDSMTEAACWHAMFPGSVSHKVKWAWFHVIVCLILLSMKVGLYLRPLLVVMQRGLCNYKLNSCIWYLGLFLNFLFFYTVCSCTSTILLFFFN